MTEETAVRIAEALESIECDARGFILVCVVFLVAFYIIALFKN